MYYLTNFQRYVFFFLIVLSGTHLVSILFLQRFSTIYILHVHRAAV